MTPGEAEEYTQSLGQIFSGSWRQIAWAAQQGIPAALGLSTEDWVRDRLGGYVRLGVPERREAAAELAGQGLSQRQVGQVLGVNQGQVSRDLRPPDANASPPPAPPQVSTPPPPEHDADASPPPEPPAPPAGPDPARQRQAEQQRQLELRRDAQALADRIITLALPHHAANGWVKAWADRIGTDADRARKLSAVTAALTELAERITP